MTDTTADDVPGVLLDIDGTLLDTVFLHTLAWVRAFRDRGHDVASAEVQRAIGLGDEFLVPHLLGHDDPAVADGHGEHFAALREEVRALPGAADLVRACHGAGLRVVLATSGKSADLEWMLPVIGAEDLVHGSTTSEDVEASKPAPDVLLTAVQAHGLDPERSVTVGDSVWDGQSSRDAGITFVGLLSGGVSETELRRAGAVAVYSDAADLVTHLAGSPLDPSWREPADRAPDEPGPQDHGGSGGMATRGL